MEKGSSRTRRALLLGALVTLSSPALVSAKSPRDKLAYLIPSLYGPQGLIVNSQARLPTGETHSAHFNSAFQSSFTQLNTSLASQLSSPPLPTPASGFTYTFDPALGIFKRTTESFGPVLSERAETIGRRKVSFGLSYQRFTFDTMEGIDLDALPAVFTHDSPAAGTGRDDVVTTTNSIAVTTNQATAFLSFGLTNRLDVAVAVPFLETTMDAASEAVVRRIGTTDPRVHYFEERGGGLGTTQRFASSRSASGLGDVVLRLKGSAFRGDAGAVALGIDVRFPTGDEEDLLGAGTFGVKPFVVFSYAAKVGGRAVSPRVNLGYQWNGESVLGGDVVRGTKGDLTNQVLFGVGLDVALTDRVTFAADVVGKRVLDSQRLALSTFRALDGRTTFPDITFRTGQYTEADAALGMKINALGRLLLDFNVLLGLNDAGLRDKVTPLVGIEYSF